MNRFSSAPPVPVLKGNILALDHDWQYPAITEEHAFRQLAAAGAVPEGVIYAAFPWATLIDKLHRKSGGHDTLLAQYREFCTQLPPDSLKVTVCQHIRMKDMLWLFREAGITEIFWPHTTRADLDAGYQDGIRLHPFPLYPVQQVPDTACNGPRPHLFSFIGARANQHYLTESRNWILDLLAEHPRGQITGRDSWHYNKVVYSHQVSDAAARKADAQTHIDETASQHFRDSLITSVFSLCPSGSGPNSIRLWESLGAGSIPVILADTWAPPGHPDLWQAAAVFCPETPAAIAALPAQLDAIAADPEALTRMRHAGRQLWLLYGPDGFIADLQAFMLDAAGGSPVPARAQPRTSGFLASQTRALAGQADMPAAAARLFLSSLTASLLLDGPTAAAAHAADPAAVKTEQAARAALPADDSTLTQLDAAQALMQRRLERCSTPALNRGAPMRVCLFGQHSSRTPLAYAPFQALVRSQLELTADPAAADLAVSGYNTDLKENRTALQAAQKRNPRLRAVILSEEPLWDSIWSGGFTQRQRHLETEEGHLSYTFLNHMNSSIFAFRRIPYFLLTDTRYLARYALLLARHGTQSPQELLRRWQTAPVPAAFYAEVRRKPAYGQRFPDQEVEGLGLYRTEVAEQTALPGVLREGQGWRPVAARRQALADWHTDKLATLDGRTRVISAYENTHQRDYITEKIFDAFAAGGIPAYYASPAHRVFELVPEAAMLNSYGRSAADAARQMTDFTPDLAFAEAWLETARALQQRFARLEDAAAERQRVAEAVLHELELCLA